MKKSKLLMFLLTVLAGCGGGVESGRDLPNAVVSCTVDGTAVKDDGSVSGLDPSGVRVELEFSSPIDFSLLDRGNIVLSGGDYTCSLSGNNTLILDVTGLEHFGNYKLSVLSGRMLGVNIPFGFSCRLLTAYDPSDKFPRIPREELLDLVQEKTFAYFWDYAHPVSGLARERLGSGETVTAGGSGFGLMAILVGIERGFISREDGYAHLLKAADFLTDKAERFHGAFPHWMDGATGAAKPFSTYDNGADLVETAFLMEGLLTCRQYFSEAAEAPLREKITDLWEAVEWDWFLNGTNQLRWHWSPEYGWKMNMGITGWNEALTVYVLAAASPTHPIGKEAYDDGWARNGEIRNGKSFYGITLPLGSDYGGPLFLAHYSFMGLDPRKLCDAYASYWEQNTAHARINHAYCSANPRHRYGYSSDCWGLTASDLPSGYGASSPANDKGTIAPTAALASMPYTPEESLAAMETFYYTYGDRLWGDYGFRDAFSLENHWFASSYIAIDQGPIVVMAENYRSGLVWDTFMKDPDVRAGLTALGFSF